MIVLDASVWISWLLPADAHHQNTFRWLTLYLRAGGQVSDPLLMLAEVGGALSRRPGNGARARRAVAYLQGLSLLRRVALDYPLAQAATQIAIDHRLRGADAVYVAVAQQLGVPLITWDNEQLTRGAAAAAVYTPATAPSLP